jgi:hypothetical protein
MPYFSSYFIINIEFKKVAWIHMLFWIDLSEIDQLSLKAQEESTELLSDSNLTLEFSKTALN